jgi:hypothetical protein
MNIVASVNAPEVEVTIPMATTTITNNRIHKDLLKSKPVATRKLIFSDAPNPDNVDDTIFFITVDGATPEAFNVNIAPAVTAIQGTVEDWIIENHALEDHIFHIHQLHFLLLEENGKKVSDMQQQYLDSVQVKYWDGVSTTYSSVKLRMDFTGDIAGTFPFHCHILEHEDKGMMAILKVTKNTESLKYNPYILSESQISEFRDNYSLGSDIIFVVICILATLGLVQIAFVVGRVGLRRFREFSHIDFSILDSSEKSIGQSNDLVELVVL